MPRDISRRKAEPGKEYKGNSVTEETPTRERAVKEGTTPISSGYSSDRRPTNLKRGGNVGREHIFSYEEGKETLIKFLDAIPFAGFWQHWIEKKPYTCLVNDCPLCDIGDTPKQVDYYNIIEFTESGPQLKLWQCTPNPIKAIKARVEGKRTSPISKEGLYFAVTKVVPANKYAETVLDPVKSEDLKEDWDTDALTPEQIEEFGKQMYTKDIVQVTPRHELVELANSLE